MIARFVAYYRVSTAQQGASGLGLEAQRRTVRDFIHGGSSELVAEFEEIESGKRSDRPQLDAAIERCKLTGATLLIAKLDRLSRNVHFLTGLMERGVDFTACDMPTANRLTVHIMAAVAQQEREAISARTKSALGSIKARLDHGGEHVSRRSGKSISRLGNPTGLSVSRPDLGTAAVIKRADQFAATVSPLVKALRVDGLSFAAIAARLDEQRIKPPRGATWSPMAVKRVLDRTCLNAD